LAETRLQRLEDLEAIRALIARYGPLADAGRAADVAELWTEDGVYEVGNFGTASGRNEIAALIESETHRGLMKQGCAHILPTPAIVLEGNRAVATGYSIVLRNTGDSWEPWRVSANRWELARQNDGSWLVTKRVNQPLDGNEKARALLGSLGELS
jgi:uncharacterized protein (TIGR02246 family)